MYLTRHRTGQGPRWALDGQYLPPDFSLGLILQVSASSVAGVLREMVGDRAAEDPLLAPIDSAQEVWAAGVTYLRSREAREHESATGDIYERVYDADRPEIFPKATGGRVAGHDQEIRVRSDSAWNVPEPELAILVNREMEIVGFTAGNDVSSRSIEGANPLYLPQAKVFSGSCALGPGIVLADADTVNDVPIALEIRRGDSTVFTGDSGTSMMKRPPRELATWLGRELEFPHGAFLMTGTGIVPPDDFTLCPGDEVTVSVGELTLRNRVGE